ncbi:MAG TPA: NADH-quinone oxidoreductase subunit C [Acidimicrobiales bacterium]|nr:NADH-quinone oxidoreductase subunit C [Acidimicrobiales bacterium]
MKPAARLAPTPQPGELEVPRGEFAAAVATRMAGARFAGLFGSAQGDGPVLLRAAVSRDGVLEVISCSVPPAGQARPASYPALTPAVPSASWYEREVADMFDLYPVGPLRVDPLVLPRSPQFPPPRPGSGPRHAESPRAPDESALPAHVSGEGVFTLPYGPVRSGIFESVQYLVETPGEDIPHVRARVYHKHRGIEVRFEGMAPADGALLAERVEGVASVAHALAFCQALEAKASGKEVPRGALLVRVLHAELERVANHLDSVLRHTEAAGQAVANARLAWHKERLLRLRAALCGHRFGRGVVVLGGVAGPPALSPHLAARELAGIEADVRADTRLLMATSSFIDRLRGTGVITAEVAAERGALGPVARASGSDEDLRTYRPYAAYGLVQVPEHRYRDGGDALSRQLVRLEELSGSFRLCLLVLEELAEGPVEGPWAGDVAPGEGISWGWAEAPQGELLYMVEVEGGRLRRVKPRSASFHNLSLFPEAFGGDIFTDFAFIEASFGLSIAGAAG